MKVDSAFPETLAEALVFFANEENAFTFMVSLRWPNGTVSCPRCGTERVGFIASRKVWECRECKVRKQFSVKVGTIFEDSPIKLGKWWSAIWLISNAKNGISSCEIHRALGVTQKTAWFMLQRIRLALQAGTFEKMKGTVEADETFIGGLARFMHKAKREAKITGGGAVGKAIVMGLLERTGKGKSRVKAKVVKNVRKFTLRNEIVANVEAGSTLNTDSWIGYQQLGANYVHEFVDHAVEYVKGNVHTNGLENFWCLLKRAIKGTYVSVNAEHLFRYLDEQSFRFNERKDNDQGRFLKAIAGIVGRRLTYLALTAGGQDNQTQAWA